MSLIIPGGGQHIPQDIQDRLAQIDPGIRVVAKQQMVPDSGADDDRLQTHWVWYVALAWPQLDPRWRMVQAGQINPDSAFDVLASIPVDCPLEQIPGYLARQITRRNGSPAKIAEAIADWNTDQSIRNGEPTSEFADELLRANFGSRPVSQFNPPTKAKT